MQVVRTVSWRRLIFLKITSNSHRCLNIFKTRVEVSQNNDQVKHASIIRVADRNQFSYAPFLQRKTDNQRSCRCRMLASKQVQYAQNHITTKRKPHILVRVSRVSCFKQNRIDTQLRVGFGHQSGRNKGSTLSRSCHAFPTSKFVSSLRMNVDSRISFEFVLLGDWEKSWIYQDRL